MIVQRVYWLTWWGIVPFCPHFIGQSSGTWPHLGVVDAGKCSLVIRIGRRRDGFRVNIQPVSDISFRGLSTRPLKGKSYREHVCVFKWIYYYITTLRRKWQPTPVLLPGKSHGRSLVGYSPWVTKSRT